MAPVAALSSLRNLTVLLPLQKQQQQRKQKQNKIMLAPLIAIQWIRSGQFIIEVDWVFLRRSAGGLLWRSGPLRHYFSLFQVVFHRRGERKYNFRREK